MVGSFEHNYVVAVNLLQVAKEEDVWRVSKKEKCD